MPFTDPASSGHDSKTRTDEPSSTAELLAPRIDFERRMQHMGMAVHGLSLSPKAPKSPSFQFRTCVIDPKDPRLLDICDEPGDKEVIFFDPWAVPALDAPEVPEEPNEP